MSVCWLQYMCVRNLSVILKCNLSYVINIHCFDKDKKNKKEDEFNEFV